MTTNRGSVSDLEIIQPPVSLRPGCLRWFGLGGTYEVPEGKRAVVVEDGIFREILEPGCYSLSRYGTRRNVQTTLVDVRRRTLTISTMGEFTIFKPVPVQIDLDFNINYQISDPRRVVLEIDQPLTELFDRTIVAARDALGHLSSEEVRKDSRGIGSQIQRSLEAMNIPVALGIRISDVLISSIKIRDTTGDILATNELKTYLELQDAQRAEAITQRTTINWAWFLVNRPEIAQQLIAQHGNLAQAMFEKMGAQALDLISGSPGQSMFGQLPGSITATPPGLISPPVSPQTPYAPPQITSGGNPRVDIHARMREESAYLKPFPRLTLQMQPGADSQGILNGSYEVYITVPSPSGQPIEILVICPIGYPQRPPMSVDVNVRGQPIAFRSQLLACWMGNYLIEIVREVQAYVP